VYGSLPLVTRSFGRRLALVAAAAFVLRVVYGLWFAPATTGISDSFYFQQTGRLVADGHGFVSPHAFLFEHRSTPTADHPPLYTLVLALEWKLGLMSDAVQRTSGAVFGTATVALIGLLGRRIGDATAGLVAAVVAAAYPLLITTDGAVLSETVYLPLIALALLLAYRARDLGTPGAGALLGGAIGLAALTRSEALLLVPLLAGPALLAGGRRGWVPLGVCALASVVVVAPWVARNWHAFGTPVLSNNFGGLVAQTNCRAAYHGPMKGDLAPGCLGPRVGKNELEQAANWRRRGLRYARDHAAELPAVAVFRLLRNWGLYQPLEAVFDAENRNRKLQRIGITAYYPLLAAAFIGLAVLLLRRQPVHLLLAPVVMVSLVAIGSYGNLRLRAAAEVPLVTLAGVGLAETGRRMREARAGRDD
jgi:4-amino-4-deoxy-L-arabinose transferase-like glycosyltransferase